jgi:hypothetical protein
MSDTNFSSLERNKEVKQAFRSFFSKVKRLFWWQKSLDQQQRLALQLHSLENQMQILEHKWQRANKDLEKFYQINDFKKVNLQYFLAFIKKVNALDKPNLKIKILTLAGENLNKFLNQKHLDLVDKNSMLIYQKILLLSLEKIYFEINYWKMDREYLELDLELTNIKSQTPALLKLFIANPNKS